MAEQQVLELREKLQNYQIQFQNYKVECKQLQSFLEEQAIKKEQEIRHLKEEAIKKEKQFQLSKNQVSALQSEVNNLKGQIKELGTKQNKSAEADNQNITKLKNQIQQLNQKYRLLLSQKQELETQLKQNLTRHSEQILQLKQQLKQKDNRMKQITLQLQTIQAEGSKQKKNRTVQIKIEKTKQVPVPQQYAYLKQMCRVKEDQLANANEKIHKLVDKIVGYQRRIIEMEHSLSQQDSARDHRQPNTRNAYKNDVYITQGSDEEEHQMIKQQQPKPIISVLFLTKQYYKSPFLDIEVKNTIKLYKTDKNGRIDKSLGSIQHKLSTISYNQQQIALKTLENVYSDIKNNRKSRIIIYGIKKSNKREIMCQLINRLKSYMFNQLQNHSDDQLQDIGVRYLETHEDFVIQTQLHADQKESIIEIINNIQISEKQKQVNLKSSKRVQKSETQKKVRYFHWYFNQKSIQIITTSFIDSEIKENLGLACALDKIAFSKIPHFNDQKCHTHIILTLNPIVGLYEECRSTLKLANCKKKVLSGSNIYDWRESPARKLLLVSSRNNDRIQEENEAQSQKIHKLSQKIQFYRSKLSELILKLKIILSTSVQASYLKKSQSVLNYEKILRFVQSLLNQGYIESHSPRKQFRTVNMQDLQSSP